MLCDVDWDVLCDVDWDDVLPAAPVLGGPVEAPPVETALAIPAAEAARRPTVRPRASRWKTLLPHPKNGQRWSIA